jgi:hypothetical protein
LTAISLVTSLARNNVQYADMPLTKPAKAYINKVKAAVMAEALCSVPYPHLTAYSNYRAKAPGFMPFAERNGHNNAGAN